MFVSVGMCKQAVEAFIKVLFSVTNNFVKPSVSL